MQKWKGLLVKLLQIIRSFEEVSHGVQAAEAQHLQGDGWRCGYAPVSGAVETAPPLPAYRGRMSKQEMYAEQIKTGIRLGPRKMTKPPTREEHGCSHPMISLCGAGNQYQREVWCQECHARWKVETTSCGPTTPTSKSSTTSQRLMAASPASTGVPSPLVGVKSVAMVCQCKLPAQRIRVLKDGPTKGRHSNKCERRLCDFFAWDPMEQEELRRKMSHSPQDPEISPEVEKMKEEMSEAMRQVRLREEKLKEQEKTMREELQEKEEALRTSQQELNQSAKGMVESVMAHADRKHGELMQGQQFQHQMEIETMQNYCG